MKQENSFFTRVQLDRTFFFGIVSHGFFSGQIFFVKIIYGKCNLASEHAFKIFKREIVFFIENCFNLKLLMKTIHCY